jgi:hypothetical protein
VASKGPGAAPNLTTEMVGLAKTLRVLDQFRVKNEGAYRGAIYMLATNVVSTALKLAPADTGYLRASRYVRKPTLAGKKFTCEVGFGAPYALYVHEMNLKYIVGEWKFLKKAVDFHMATAARDLAAWTAHLASQGKTIDDVPETHPRIWTGGLRVVPKRKSARARKKYKMDRAIDRQKNVLRMARESAAHMAAVRAGKRPPRPGRG